MLLSDVGLLQTDRRSSRNGVGLGRLRRDSLAISSLFFSIPQLSGGILADYKRPPREQDSPVAVQVNDKNYHPSDREPFMNERQREYFRNKLLAWKEDILKEAQETLQHLQDENQNHPDFADRASAETERAIELRARDRQRKLIGKIDAALQRIDDGTYGYCEETGEPISLRRLEARPIATLSITAQEGHEQRERVYRDD